MDSAITIVSIVIGFPVLGGSLIAIVALLRSWWLRARELSVQEQRIRMEEKLRSDELNARILAMDDAGASASQVEQLMEEIRQLRQEVGQVRQDVNNIRIVG